MEDADIFSAISLGFLREDSILSNEIVDAAATSNAFVGFQRLMIDESERKKKG